MAVTGKTGADAVFKAVNHICRVNVKFGARLQNVIVLTRVAELITDEQEAALIAFLNGLTAICAAWESVSKFSGIN